MCAKMGTPVPTPVNAPAIQSEELPDSEQAIIDGCKFKSYASPDEKRQADHFRKRIGQSWSKRTFARKSFHAHRGGTPSGIRAGWRF